MKPPVEGGSKYRAKIKNNKILIITMFGMVIALERTSKYRAKSRGGYSSLIWGLPDGG